MFQSPDEDSFAPKLERLPSTWMPGMTFQSPDEDSFAPKRHVTDTDGTVPMSTFQSPDEDSFAPKR